MKNALFLLLCSIGLFWNACTSTKPTVEPPTPTPPTTPTPPKEEFLSKEGCVKWFDLTYAEKEETENNYVIYRNRLKNKDMDGAFELWQKVYDKAPAADGRRKTVYLDGVDFYTAFFNNETDTIKKRAYVNSVKELYQEGMECYGEEGFFYGMMGFDLYYNFYDYSTDEERYKFLKKSIDLNQNETPAFVINPFTALLLNRYLKEEISMAEAQEMAAKIPEIIQWGLTESDEKESFEIVNSYAPARLEELEGVEGFYDCDYYATKYLTAFDRHPSNCDSIVMAFSRLSWGKCSPSDPRFLKVAQAYKTNCDTPEPGGTTSTAGQAYNALREGRYRDAVGLFDQAITEESDSNKKAKYALVNAKIYFSYLKKFYKSRDYARQSLRHNPNSGEPYMLIGRLYASSGPICGPGRGWDSQIVTWPAIDKWKKAKSIDPRVATEANKLINTYRKFMPSREDIFQRGLKEGQSFKIPCWIKETTTIRAAE